MTKFEMDHHIIFKFLLSAASTSALQLKVEAYTVPDTLFRARYQHLPFTYLPRTEYRVPEYRP